MNAVACLACEMNRLDAGTRDHLEPFFLKAAKIQGILHALIDACLGSDALSQAGAPLFEYPLIPEEEHGEGIPAREASPPSPVQNNINITLSSLQAGSLAGSLAEAFSGFASQTAALADIYSPVAPTGGTTGTDLPWVNVSLPPSTGTAGAHTGPTTARADTATVPESLSRSASVLRTLESCRTDLTRMLFSDTSAIVRVPVTENRTASGPLSVYPREEDLPGIPDRSGTSRGLRGRDVHGPEAPGTMFTILHGMLQKAERIVAVPFSEKLPPIHTSLPVLPGIGIPGAEYPVMARGSATALPPPVAGQSPATAPPLTATEQRSAPAPLYPVTEQQSATPLPVTARQVHPAPEYPARRGKPSRRTAKGLRSRPAMGIIEIPALVPGEVKDLRSEMATMNADRLSEGIARLSGGGTAHPLPSETIPQAATRFLRSPGASSPAVSVPDAFEKIAQYLSYSTDIHRQFMIPLVGVTAGSGPGIFPVPLPFPVSEGGGGGFSPGLVLQGKDICSSALDSPVMKLAISMVSSDAMQRAHLFPLSAATASPQPGMPFGSAFSGTFPVSSLVSLERALPPIAGSRSETGPPATGGDRTTRFQNTFNITVTTTARGEEAELRELGRKIGSILSDEMKRYGGLR